MTGTADLLIALIGESYIVSLDFRNLGQMPLGMRTIRDRDYSEILKKYGPLSNSDLCKKAADHPHFSKLTPSAIEKDIDRFVKHYEYLGIIVRKNGRIEWLPPPTMIQGQPKEESKVESDRLSPPDSQYEAVQKLIKGLADGSIKLKDKSPHKELNRIKGEIYDDFMKDIDLYNSNLIGFPFTSVLESRIFNTALKLRAFGFIEEVKEPPC